jgi:ubiquinone/menaquinone biosynthesis C-methylase UbiE
VRDGDAIADIGAGTGFFALEAARRVGPRGRVYAIDLSAELVALLKERKEREGLAALIPLQNTTSSIPLGDAVADLVLLANVLHDVPPPTLREAVRLLRPRGRLVNLDWKKEETPGGPPPEIRLTAAEAAEVFGEYGLEEVERWEFGPWHYAQILRRPWSPGTDLGAGGR